MELTDLIVKLNKEAVKHTPDVFNKVMSAARSQGLVRRQRTNDNQTNEYRESDYRENDYRESAPRATRRPVNSGRGVSIIKNILWWIFVLLIIATSVTVLTFTIPVVINGGGGSGQTSPASPNAPQAPQQPSTPVAPTEPDDGKEEPEEPEEPEPPVTTPTEPDGPASSHDHVYSETFIFDNDNHWTVCNDCGDKKVVAHTFNNAGVCTDCEYKTGFEYTLYGSSYSIAIGTVTDKNITIPAVYNGKPVTEIANGGFKSLAFLESVVIPYGVKTIEGFAFGDCAALKSVSIPDSVELISFCAFQDCTSLESIVIPDSVTVMNEGTFWGCTSLKSATIGKNVQSIGNSTFDSCSNLKEVTIKNTGITILSGVFAQCTSLVKINFEGTTDEWKGVLERSKNDGNDVYWGYRSGKFTVYCTDGQVTSEGVVTRN